MSALKNHPMNGKVVVITGAADGIGEALAHRLHRGGVKLALIDRDADRLLAVAERLGGALSFAADVTNEGDMKQAMTYFNARLGGFDVVVANAGIADECPVISEHSTEILRRTLEVNVVGVHITIAEAWPYIREGGYVLVTSSLAAGIQLPMMFAYSASKMAVEAYANTLRIESRGTGITVGRAHYSFLKTKMTEKVQGEAAREVLSKRRLRGAVKVAPLEPAIDRIEKGIINQSSLIVAPGWVQFVLPIGRIVQPFVGPFLGNVQSALEISRRNQETQV